MRNITSNLYFGSFVILLLGIGIWYLLTDSNKTEKQGILSIFTDVILYFSYSALGINGVLNIQEIIQMPYRIFIFSSNIIFLATLFVLIHHMLKYGQKLWRQPKKAQSVAELLLIIGLINHMYLYFLHSALQSILLITFYLSFLLLITGTKISQKWDPLLLLFLGSTIHMLLMRGQPVIYFNFTFYPLPLFIIMLVFIGLLSTQRRKRLSKLN